jgi:L,D-transpeptidase ErfK/SrfK
MRGGLAVIVVVLIASGCGVRGPSPSPAPPAPAARYDEPLFARKPLASYTIPTPKPGVPTDTVIGSVRKVKVRTGDTLLDIARLYDLGYEELHGANPTLDPWVPRVGADVVLPTAFVLPCCSYDGLVINIPEMRVYFYRPGARAGTTIVETFPLGIGRGDFKTPMGVFHVKGKTVNPGWGVPEKIRLEHLRERGDGRSFIKGGDPDNPLGKYRFELDRTLYRIHATNFPWGIGRLVSHGCSQLYPEDMAHLFPLVPIGTRVEFIYQPVKVGRRGDATWVEAHPDIYKKGGQPFDLAETALRAQNLTADTARVRAAVQTTDGVPRVVHDGDWWRKFL